MTTTCTLDLPAGTLAYDDAGAGPLVVCVPGMGDLRGSFAPLAERLVAAGFRVVTVDLRGHGESSTGWAAHDDGALGEDVVALLRHLDAGPAHLVGHSMGSGAVVCAAGSAQDLVRSVVLVGPFVRDDDPPPPWMLPTARVLFARPWGPQTWRWWYRRLHVTAPADHDAHTARIAANLAEPGRLEALQAMIRAPKARSAAHLAHIAAPVLVVMGAGDPDFPDPAAEARTVAERTHGEVLMVPAAGHYPHREQPAVVADAVTAFFTPRGGLRPPATPLRARDRIA